MAGKDDIRCDLPNEPSGPRTAPALLAALMASLLLLSLLSAPALAANQPYVTGKVTDWDDLAPVAGAAVSLIRGEKVVQTTTSDKSGEFRFDGIEGDYEVSAYKGEQQLRVASIQPHTAGTGKSLSVHAVGRLLDDSERKGSLAGRVADADGAVLKGVLVTLVPSDGSANRKAVTDAKGEFMFLDLAPGEYLLSWSSGDVQMTYDVTVSPGLLSTAYLTPKEAEAPKDMPKGIVYGTVRDEDGGVVEDAYVRLALRGKDSLWTARTDSNGSFVMKNVPPGAYVLNSSKSGRALSVTVSAHSSSPTSDIEVAAPIPATETSASVLSKGGLTWQVFAVAAILIVGALCVLVVGLNLKSKREEASRPRTRRKQR